MGRGGRSLRKGERGKVERCEESQDGKTLNEKAKGGAHEGGSKWHVIDCFVSYK